MSSILRGCRLAILAILLVLPAAMAQAAPVIMPLEDVRAGMQGIAKTVVSGTAIEEFGIEVLGIMKNKGPSGDLILVRTSGDLIERTGGIAQGMSGSPVYIDGKLVGAIAYGWTYTDHKVGMVTPIAHMLKLWELPPAKPRFTPAEPIVLDLGAESVATPLMAAGFSERALALLGEKLRPYNMVPYAVGSEPEGISYGRIEPGSAVGVQLVRGDVSLGALGTVTYVEGDKVLAFGHPFLKRGASEYFLTNAYVLTTIKGLENSFKVGAVGPAVGLFNQDRGAGIAGQMGRFPSVVPLRITVKDSALGTSRVAEVQVVQDELLFPAFAAASVLSIIEKTSDRVGAGTAKISFEITANNMPGDVFKRDNMFYSPANIGEAAISELYELMALLAANQFQAVDIIDIGVDVAVEPERRTATIMEAKANVASAGPGDKVEIKVSLKPYRGETITKTVPFTIPYDQPPGAMTLEVRGGGMVSLLELLSRKDKGEEDIIQSIGKMKTRTFDDLIKEMAERDRNNDIVVEVMSGDLGSMLGEMGPTKAPATKLEPSPKPSADGGKRDQRPSKGKEAAKKTEKANKSNVSTEYIIDSDAQVIIIVGDGAGKSPPKPPSQSEKKKDAQDKKPDTKEKDAKGKSGGR